MYWHNSTGKFISQHAVYSRLFSRLARGLWLILSGWLGMIGGLTVMAPVIFMNSKNQHFPGEKWVLAAGGLLLIGGFLLNLTGKWVCADMHKRLPRGSKLPGHHWLLASLWCDFGSFSARWLAAGIGIRQIRLFAGPLAIGSQVFFLLFLRKTADVIEQPILKRLCEGLLGATGVLLVAGTATVGCLAARVQGPLAIVSAAVTAFTLLVSAPIYLATLFLMARATGQFAEYLRARDGAVDDVDGNVDYRVKSVLVINAAEPD